MALGSCIAVLCYCPHAKAAGMVHIALPDSTINPEIARTRPGYFADTGIPILLNQMKTLGCFYKNHFHIKLIGGASILDANKHFNVGERNVDTARSILRELNLPIIREDVGKTLSRTVAIHTENGQVDISSPRYGLWHI